MEQLNFNLPSKEFVEQNFQKIMEGLNSLKNQLNSSKKELKYFRNKDLKRIFGFSDNTIIEYREKGILPFTKFGLIYFYPVEDINRILQENSNKGKFN